MRTANQFFLGTIGQTIDYDLTSESGWLHCYSLAKRINTYLGSCLRIIRDSDSAEQDIGFDSNGVIDVFAIVSFCTGTIGRVKIFYDQFGSINLIGIGTLPQIYNGGFLNFISTLSVGSFEFDFDTDQTFSLVYNGIGSVVDILNHRGNSNSGLVMNTIVGSNFFRMTYYSVGSFDSPITKNGISVASSSNLNMYAVLHNEQNVEFECSAYVRTFDSNQLINMGTVSISGTYLPTTVKSRLSATVDTSGNVTGYRSARYRDIFLFSENKVDNLNIFKKRYQ
jgi:hypothetical protein